MAMLQRKILEELIFERVRVTVDLCELMTFEEDLAASIERALLGLSRSPSEREQLVSNYLARAWERLGEDVISRLRRGDSLAPRAPRGEELAPDPE